MSRYETDPRSSRPILANLLAELELETFNVAERTRRPRAVVVRAVRARHSLPSDNPVNPERSL